MTVAALSKPRALARRAARSPDVRRAAALGGVALVVRVLFVMLVERKGYPPDFASPAAITAQLVRDGLFNDAYFYHRTADLLATGQGFSSNPGVPTAQWPPVYPLLLSLVYRSTGPEPLAGELLNALLGALTVPLLYGLARRAFGRPEASFAGAALAIFPGQILWTDVLLAETTYTLMLVAVLALACVLSPRPLNVVLVGLAIGLATLTRGEGLLLAPAVAAVWWPALGRRRALALAAALAGIAVLTIVPWTVRNATTMDAFIPLSTNSSTTLWSGHNPEASGAQNYAGPDLLQRIPQAGKEREVEEGRLLRREAFEFMVENPRRELELIPLKLANLARGDSHALEWVNAGPAGERPVGEDAVSPVRVGADAAWYALLAATIASLLVLGRPLWRRPVVRGVLVIFTGSLVLYGFVYYGNYRYRVPLEPLMLLVAAPLAARVWARRAVLREP